MGWDDNKVEIKCNLVKCIYYENGCVHEEPILTLSDDDGIFTCESFEKLKEQ